MWPAGPMTTAPSVYRSRTPSPSTWCRTSSGGEAGHTNGGRGPRSVADGIPIVDDGYLPYTSTGTDIHIEEHGDPDIKRPNPCAGVILPAALTGPHAAGLGIKFYTGSMFPRQYQNVGLIARRGSWNREKKFGYDVVLARVNGARATIEPFMTGLLDNAKNEFHGRPTYVYQMPDGAMLVSDEQHGAIYRISYGGGNRVSSR